MTTGRLDSNRLKLFQETGWSLPVENTLDDTVACDGNAPYNGYCGPTDDVLNIAESPLDLFLHFIPKKLWVLISKETNQNYKNKLPATIEARFANNRNNKTLEDIEFEAKCKLCIYILVVVYNVLVSY